MSEIIDISCSTATIIINNNIYHVCYWYPSMTSHNKKILWVKDIQTDITYESIAGSFHATPIEYLIPIFQNMCDANKQYFINCTEW